MKKEIPHVELILFGDNTVRLTYLTATFQNIIIDEGYELTKDENGKFLIHYEPDDVNNNEHLTSLFLFLAKNGAAFEVDFKNMTCPSEIMRLLKENGSYKGPYIECGYDGNQWNYREK